eukprot:768787-Hanusia_phi.AAC.10
MSRCPASVSDAEGGVGVARAGGGARGAGVADAPEQDLHRGGLQHQPVVLHVDPEALRLAQIHRHGVGPVARLALRVERVEGVATGAETAGGAEHHQGLQGGGRGLRHPKQQRGDLEPRGGVAPAARPGAGHDGQRRAAVLLERVGRAGRAGPGHLVVPGPALAPVRVQEAHAGLVPPVRPAGDARARAVVVRAGGAGLADAIPQEVEAVAAGGAHLGREGAGAGKAAGPVALGLVLVQPALHAAPAVRGGGGPQAAGFAVGHARIGLVPARGAGHAGRLERQAHLPRVGRELGRCGLVRPRGTILAAHPGSAGAVRAEAVGGGDVPPLLAVDRAPRVLRCRVVVARAGYAVVRGELRRPAVDLGEAGRAHSGARVAHAPHAGRAGAGAGEPGNVPGWAVVAPPHPRHAAVLVHGAGRAAAGLVGRAVEAHETPPRVPVHAGGARHAFGLLRRVLVRAQAAPLAHGAARGVLVRPDAAGGADGAAVIFTERADLALLAAALRRLVLVHAMRALHADGSRRGAGAVQARIAGLAAHTAGGAGGKPRGTHGAGGGSARSREVTRGAGQVVGRIRITVVIARRDERAGDGAKVGSVGARLAGGAGACPR